MSLSFINQKVRLFFEILTREIYLKIFVLYNYFPLYVLKSRGLSKCTKKLKSLGSIAFLNERNYYPKK